MAARSLTRGERVYRALREDILAGRLTPGTRLPFADLCATYDASMGVLREGLSRLAEQGLVQLEPQQGYRVTPLSVADLTELTDARVHVESLVLREAVAHGDVEWESDVIARHHTLTRTPDRALDGPDRLSAAWTAAHADFHSAVLAGCPNRRLRAIADGLRATAELYRQWSFPLAHAPARDIAGEHRALLDAVIAREADAAVAVLTAHIRRTSDVLLERVADEAPGGGRHATA
jgi:DNA-binding GntR family transcriptional regulator